LAGAYELVEFPLKRIFHKRRAQDAASIAFMPDTFSGSGGLNLPIRKPQRLKESMTRIANALTGGTWGGKGAAMLGLKGEVQRNDFVALINNRWPRANGERLTVRMNKTRLEDVKDKKTGLPVIDPETGNVQKREVSNRRVGYDLTFSVPKSVSLYLAVNQDKVVEQVIAEALDETMATIEARMETKVRKGYLHDNRVSPNMVYAKFVHGESRPVDGIPDPHYHIHVFAMNATFDEVENEWKALEVGNTVGDRTFYEAHFHHLLAAKLDASGYGIRRTEQHFEFASVNRELVEKFSRRTELIEQRARDKYKVLEAEARALMKSTNMAFDDAFAHVIAEIGGDWDKWKSNLGARNRESKSSAKYEARQELVAHWQSEMTPEERESLRPECVKKRTFPKSSRCWRREGTGDTTPL